MGQLARRQFLWYAIGAWAWLRIAGTNSAAQSVSPPVACSDCTHDLRDNPSSFERALLAYITALSERDWVTAARYVARFRFGSDRRRAYRGRAEQEALLRRMAGRPVRAVHFCMHATSTAELSYPVRQRQHSAFVCLVYADHGVERTARVIVHGYQERGGWVFSPLMAPDETWMPTLVAPATPGPPSIEPPPPPMSPN